MPEGIEWTITVTTYRYGNLFALHLFVTPRREKRFAGYVRKYLNNAMRLSISREYTALFSSNQLTQLLGTRSGLVNTN